MERQKTLKELLPVFELICRQLRVRGLSFNRIEFMYKIFKIYLITLNKNQIEKISFKIKKTFSNFTDVKIKKLDLLFSKKINLKINHYIKKKKNNLKKQIYHLLIKKI